MIFTLVKTNVVSLIIHCKQSSIRFLAVTSRNFLEENFNDLPLAWSASKRRMCKNDPCTTLITSSDSHQLHV